MSNIEEGKTPEQKAVLYVSALAVGNQEEASRIFESVDFGEDFSRFCQALDEYPVAGQQVKEGGK